jgi:hypothetical protein
MQRLSIIIALSAGFAMLARPVDAAQSDVTPLHAGDRFPQLSGQTLTDKSLTLPAAAAGRDAVLVFSFTRKAGNDARAWNEHLSRDFPNTIPIYTVILLESAPKLFRGMAVSGIRSSMPPSLQDRTIVLYRDEKLWKQRLAVADDSRAYVLLLEPSGHISWTNSSAFSDAAYASLRSRLRP